MRKGNVKTTIGIESPWGSADVLLGSMGASGCVYLCRHEEPLLAPLREDFQDFVVDSQVHHQVCVIKTGLKRGEVPDNGHVEAPASMANLSFQSTFQGWLEKDGPAEGWKESPRSPPGRGTGVHIWILQPIPQ